MEDEDCCHSPHMPLLHDDAPSASPSEIEAEDFAPPSLSTPASISVESLWCPPGCFSGCFVSHSNGYCCMSSQDPDELLRFRQCLLWLGLTDQTTPLRLAISWAFAILMTFFVPALYLSVTFVPYADSIHQRHHLVYAMYISETALAAISFACLSHNLRKHGLRRFLFLDQISTESLEVQNGYVKELKRAFRLLQTILLTAFLVEVFHQIWWFTHITTSVHFPSTQAIKTAFIWIAMLLSWLYKATTFLLPCILFRLMCELQNLRFRGYIKMLESAPKVLLILKGYMHLRKQLTTISHRFRVFIVLSLVIITFSQFMFLLMATATLKPINLSRAGNVGVCSVIQLVGFVICLHGAARVTHRAQGIVSIVGQWHAILSCQTDNGTDPDTSPIIRPEFYRLRDVDSEFDLSSIFSAPLKNDKISFQMRQAFVSYVQHDQVGISLFGYMLDRSFVYALASVVLSLLLFVLGLKIGID